MGDGGLLPKVLSPVSLRGKGGTAAQDQQGLDPLRFFFDLFHIGFSMEWVCSSGRKLGQIN